MKLQKPDKQIRVTRAVNSPCWRPATRMLRSPWRTWSARIGDWRRRTELRQLVSLVLLDLWRPQPQFPPATTRYLQSTVDRSSSISVDRSSYISIKYAAPTELQSSIIRSLERKSVVTRSALRPVSSLSHEASPAVTHLSRWVEHQVVMREQRPSYSGMSPFVSPIRSEIPARTTGSELRIRSSVIHRYLRGHSYAEGATGVERGGVKRVRLRTESPGIPRIGQETDHQWGLVRVMSRIPQRRMDRLPIISDRSFLRPAGRHSVLVNLTPFGPANRSQRLPEDHALRSTEPGLFVSRVSGRNRRLEQQQPPVPTTVTRPSNTRRVDVPPAAADPRGTLPQNATGTVTALSGAGSVPQLFSGQQPHAPFSLQELTSHVLSQLDRRIIKARERMGRV